MADAVAGEGQVPIGRVLAPALPERREIGFDLGPRDAQHRAQDAAFGKLDHRVNAGQALGPCSAQKFPKHRLGLVVARVGGSHSVHLARGHQFAEPAVAKPPRSLLDRFSRLRPFAASPHSFLTRFGTRFGMSPGLGRRIHPGFVEDHPELRGQIAGKLEVPVGLLAAQPVVQVGGVQHQPQFPAPLAILHHQRAQQGHRVRAAGKADGHPQTRLELR